MAQISRRQSEQLSRQKGNAGPIHLTKDGLERMKGQLARLKKNMPDLIVEAQRTAAYGDRSDNAEYKEAKSSLRRAQGRIFNIEDQLKRIVVIEPDRNMSGTVQLGSTVVLEMEPAHSTGSTGLPHASSGQAAQKTFQILGPHETDPANGRISYNSPLGAALMNRAKGDTVTVHPPGGGESGDKIYRIIEIR